MLLVEADEETRRLFTDMLAAAGQTVHSTGELTEAVAIAHLVKPDLIAVGTTGSEAGLLHACWTLRRASEAPILVMEPSPDTPGDFTVLEVVREDAAPRLLSLPQLISRATFGPNERLRRLPVKALPDRHSVGAVTLDRAGRRLLIGGRDVHLSAREFDLLSFLMAYPGRVHSTESLLRQVWGDRASPPDRRTVMVHIRWLRDKLGSQEDVEIVTVRGAGYRLDLGPAEVAS